MNEQEIIEGNRLIAEFDDGIYDRHWGQWLFEIDGERMWHIESDLEYHSSFDWLIPVTEKFEKLGCEFVISTGSIIITWDDGTAYYDRQFVGTQDKLQLLYSMIVKLITWYNNKTHEPKN